MGMGNRGSKWAWKWLEAISFPFTKTTLSHVVYGHLGVPFHSPIVTFLTMLFWIKKLSAQDRTCVNKGLCLCICPYLYVKRCVHKKEKKRLKECFHNCSLQRQRQEMCINVLLNFSIGALLHFQSLCICSHWAFVG